MKVCAILVVILASAWAAEEQKPTVKAEQGGQNGLQWPLPDLYNEGDLMLLGAQLFDRVGELRKQKAENDLDRMILGVGRNFLRLAEKYLQATPDFKIPPVLCRDTRNLNSTDRWEIRIPSGHDQPNTLNEEQTNQNNKQNDQGESGKQSNQNDQKTNAHNNNNNNDNNNNNNKANDPSPRAQNSNSSNENASDAVPAGNYETQRDNFYEQMGANFARLLIKIFKKENLNQAESHYMEALTSDEAVHYGVMGIYCREGENVKEIMKKMQSYLEEKQ